MLRHSKSERKLFLLPGEIYRDWESAYRLNVGDFYSEFFDKVGNQRDAERLTTELFERILRSTGAPIVVEQFRRDAATVSRACLADFWLSRTGYEVTTTTEHYPGVEDYLVAVPSIHRRVLRLRVLESQSAVSTADALGRSPRRVDQLLSRSLRLFAALIDGSGREA